MAALRSFRALRAVEPGFDPTGVLTVRLVVPEGEVADAREAHGFFRQLLERLAVQPGVVSVGAVSALPLSGSHRFGSLELEDPPRAPTELPPMAGHRFVEPGTFRTLGVPVLEGRELRPGDAADGFRAALVSASFARRWWPGRARWGGGCG